MKYRTSLEAPCNKSALFGWVDDLADYHQWLTIIASATPVEPNEGKLAWDMELRARVGPFARSKRLRMVRTEFEIDRHVRFVRCENDGRSHSDWDLRADVESTSCGSLLTMQLEYGGSLWGPILSSLLDDEIERAKARLLDIVGPG